MMNKPVRQPPSFVPTLTEIVAPPAVSPATTKPASEVEALVKEVWQQIRPLVTQRLQEESEQWLQVTLAQHLREINARMQSDLELLVRQAVMDALKSQNRANLDAAPDDI